MKKRIDQILVERGLVESRSKASALIKEGKVFLNGESSFKPSLKLTEEEIQTLEVNDEDNFVGRGAKKLLGALEYFNLTVDKMICADVGASTGGFTQVLLSHGANKVYAIDVGHDQLAKSLREDDRVINHEGINIRNGIELEEKVDLVVADLSYISLKLTLEPMLKLLKENGKAVILVKPQFEVGKENVGKGGIVKDLEIVKNTLFELFDYFESLGAYIHSAMKSTITGKTGNQEYLFYVDLSMNESQISKTELESL